MILSSPKTTCLDTFTWGNLARDVPSDNTARALVKRFQEGRIVPYLTWHHIAELLHHEDEDVVRQRISFLRTLPFIGFLRQPESQAYIGSILDLRDAEIGQLLTNPTLSHREIVERVRPLATNGFTSGSQLCEENEEWWSIYRKHFASDVRRRQAEVSALTHFPNADLSEQVVGTDRKYHVRPLQEAQATFARLAEELSARLAKDVKKPLADPKKLAWELMREAYEEGLVMYGSAEEGINPLLKVYDVERDRIPSKATVGDVGEEAVFIKQLSINEQRLGLPIESLRQFIRKEMLPSWQVGSDIDRAIKRLPKAESGNLNDKFVVPFGLYVDALQVDKRVRHCVDELARNSELISIIKERLLRGRTCDELASELDVIGSG